MTDHQIDNAMYPLCLTRRDSGVDVESRHSNIQKMSPTCSHCHPHQNLQMLQKDIRFVALTSRDSIAKSISFQTTHQAVSNLETSKRSYEATLSQTLVFQVPKRQKSCPAISALHTNDYIKLISNNYPVPPYNQFPVHNAEATSLYCLPPLETKAAWIEEDRKSHRYTPSKRLLALLCSDGRHLPRQLLFTEYTAIYHLRKEVIRWIHQVNAGFLRFHSETIFMAINFLDRFIEKCNLRWRQRIYHVALGCVYIAGKFNEETREPMIGDMVECAKYATSADKIKKVEKEILSVLGWEIRVTTPQAMLDELLSCLPEARSTPEQCAYSDQVVKAAQLYLDMASFEWAYLQYSPLTLAVSAFKCGLIHLDFDDLNETVDIACSLTSVCQESLRTCVHMM
ncbi:hypothetical protein BC943DRAFT_349887, partial [Umbelopsis sp. AD052]